MKISRSMVLLHFVMQQKFYEWLWLVSKYLILSLYALLCRSTQLTTTTFQHRVPLGLPNRPVQGRRNQWGKGPHKTISAIGRGYESKIGQNCQWIVLKNCRHEEGGFKNPEKLPTLVMDGPQLPPPQIWAGTVAKTFLQNVLDKYFPLPHCVLK